MNSPRKFLVDESSGKSAADALRRMGYDVTEAADVSLGGDDGSVIQRAVRENRILVTNDKDFGELVFRQRAKCPGVMLIRLRKDGPAHRARAIQRALTAVGGKLIGSFVTVTEGLVRVHPL